MSENGEILSAPRVIRFRYAAGKKTDKNKAPSSAKRGACSGKLTKDSRRRLSILLASLLEVELTHITVTYGDRYPTDPDSVKDDFRRFRKRLHRIGLSGIWRLEWQSRGAPHYHCLFLNLEPGDELAIAEAWEEVSGNDSQYAVDVRSGSNGRAAWYLALHQSKAVRDQETAMPGYNGRSWGYFDRASVLQWVDQTSVGSLNWETDPKAMIWLWRLYRRYLKSNGRKCPDVAQGITWFLPRCNHGRLLRAIEELARPPDQPF